MPLTIGNDKAQIFSFQVKRTWIGTVLRKIQGQEHRPNKCLLINACSWLFFADDTNFNDNIDIQFFTAYLWIWWLQNYSFIPVISIREIEI